MAKVVTVENLEAAVKALIAGAVEVTLPTAAPAARPQRAQDISDVLTLARMGRFWNGDLACDPGQIGPREAFFDRHEKKGDFVGLDLDLAHCFALWGYVGESFSGELKWDSDISGYTLQTWFDEQKVRSQRGPSGRT